jgi:succinate-semialdehyde dehydrogenase/glutarate-semialdehyde dehydrogenase
LRDQLATQVQKSLAQGAKALLGSAAAAGRFGREASGAGKGFFYPPTVLSQVAPGQTAFDEELFGPVAAVIEARDEADAFRLANLSHYGLGGAVFSRDVSRARELALTEMDSGMVFINDFVKSDVLVPFGGVKDSGLGRELGREGVFEFTNIKTLYAPPR